MMKENEHKNLSLYKYYHPLGSRLVDILSANDKS